MMTKNGIQDNCSFTGKERDEETRYGYFGARYMDHEQMTMWLSVDPLADKYPSISPYAYCAWNPVKLVDPDGRDVWELNKSGELIWKSSSEQDEIRTSSGNSITVKNGILTKEKTTQKRRMEEKVIYIWILKRMFKVQNLYFSFLPTIQMWNIVLLDMPTQKRI
jgi:RHS repeat-associated protein